MMNIKEFKDRIDRVYARVKDYDIERTRVVIPVYVAGTVGATPSVEVTSVNAGFDWDNNTFFIEPSTQLREIDRDEVKSIRNKYEELGWSLYKINNIKRENKKLKEKVAELEARLNDERKD